MNIAAVAHEMSEFAHTELTPRRAVLSVVGSNIGNSPLLMARLFSALGSSELEMVSFGASRSSVTILLDETSILDAVRRVHAEFFGHVGGGTMFEVLNNEPIALTVA